jgi:DNA-binding winged helix-turn-helix (wHTH) protein/TolB-like protein
MGRTRADEEPTIEEVGFGPFSFDQRTLELRRDGRPVRLQPLPSRVLGLLLSRPGRLVTRDELRDTIWAGRVLEFDGGLNFTIRRIRRALGDDAASPRYVETVHGRGYRFVAPVEPAARQSARSPGRRASRTAWIAAAALPVVALGVIGLTLLGDDVAEPSARPPVVAVLPFSDLDPDADLGPLSLGLTEDLITELATLGPDRLLVIAPTSARRFAASASDDGLAVRLGADFVVRGSVQVEADARRINVRIERLVDGGLVWAGRYDRPHGEALSAQVAIARDVAAAFSLDVLGLPARAHATELPEPLRDSVLAARWLLDQGSRGSAEAALLRLDAVRSAVPDHAPTWVVTARARRVLGDRAGAAAAAAEAIRLDASLPGAHYEAGIAAQQDLRLTEALASYRAAVDLAPGISSYRQRLADVLANLLHFDEAIRHIEFARRLDPISPAVEFDLHMAYLGARRWDDAQRYCSQSHELIPEEIWPRMCLLTSAYFSGDLDEAARVARGLAELRGAGGGVRDGLEGPSAEALRAYFRWELEQLVAQRERGEFAPDYAFARVAGQLGDRAAVLEHLGRVAATRGFSLQWATREVWFDFLRGDPEFERILGSAGLPSRSPGAGRTTPAASRSRGRGSLPALVQAHRAGALEEDEDQASDDHQPLAEALALTLPHNAL